MRPIGVPSENERNALAMRREGATYAQIGKALGLSGSQAKVLETRGLRAERASQKSPEHKAPFFLGVRSVNGLANSQIGIDIFSKNAHLRAARLRASDLLNVPNFSKSSLTQIQDWLLSNGMSLTPEPETAKHKPICPHCGKVI